MAFVGFDRVLHAQYGAYMEYAGQEVGAGTVKLAQKIMSLGIQQDDGLREMNHLLQRERGWSPLPSEFMVFTVRGAEGGWDIYLVDEDDIFIAAAAGVADSKVASAFEGMWQAYLGELRLV